MQPEDALLFMLSPKKGSEDSPESESNTLGDEAPSTNNRRVLTTYDSHTAKFALT